MKFFVLAVCYLVLGVNFAQAEGTEKNGQAPADKYVCLSRSDMERYAPGLLSDLEKKYGPNLGVNPEKRTSEKVVGISREIGIAMNEALSSLTKHSEELAHTGVGQFTLFIVAWKIMGRDFSGLVLGFPLLLCLFILFISYWRKNGIPIMIEDKVEEDDGVKTIKYKIRPAYPCRQLIFGLIFLAFMFTFLGII